MVGLRRYLLILPDWVHGFLVLKALQLMKNVPVHIGVVVHVLVIGGCSAKE
jgi:hypothetical protein